MFLRLAAFHFAVVQVLAATIPPVPPTEDSFYTPPSGYETEYNPGDIIAHRPVPGILASLILPEKVKNAWQLLVRSEDSLGNANAIVTTLIEPYNADPSKLLSYQIAEDNAYLNCAPSYQLQVGVLPDTTSQPENIFMIAALNQGWYVVTPDYEGPKSAFTAGKQEAKATLNSIRAVLKSGNFTGIDSSPSTALWGYSGGTIATGWSVTLAPTYAPELKFVGAAVGGFVPNITATIEYISGSVFAGFGIAGMAGLAADYPSVLTIIDQQIISSSSWRLAFVKTVCLAEVLIANVFLDIWGLFKPGKDILWYPALNNVLQSLSMIQPDHLPNTPVYIYHAVADEVAPIAPVETIYENWCSRGVSIDFQFDLVGEHVTEAVLGSGKAFVWLIDRLNGIPAPKGCHKSVNLSSALDLQAVVALGSFLVDALLAILQANVTGNKVSVLAAVG